LQCSKQQMEYIYIYLIFISIFSLKFCQCLLFNFISDVVLKYNLTMPFYFNKESITFIYHLKVRRY